MELVDLAIIAAIWVFIIDISGVIDEAEFFLYRLLKFKAHIPKPFSCSLCMTFWSGLAYLLIKGIFTWPLFGYVCLLAMLTPVMNDIFIVIREGLRRIIGRLL